METAGVTETTNRDIHSESNKKKGSYVSLLPKSAQLFKRIWGESDRTMGLGRLNAFSISISLKPQYIVIGKMDQSKICECGWFDINPRLLLMMELNNVDVILLVGCWSRGSHCLLFTRSCQGQPKSFSCSERCWSQQKIWNICTHCVYLVYF